MITNPLFRECLAQVSDKTRALPMLHWLWVSR